MRLLDFKKDNKSVPGSTSNLYLKPVAGPVCTSYPMKVLAYRPEFASLVTGTPLKRARYTICSMPAFQRRTAALLTSTLILLQ